MFKGIVTYSLLSLVALGGFFGNVHIETANQSYSIVSVSYDGNGIYAAGGCANPDGFGICPGEPGYNADGTAGKSGTSSANQLKLWNNLIDTLNIILGIITAIVSPAIMFAGWLMSPDWTSGDIFGLRAPMYSLWVTVSNIVYFVYAILLILIALGTMFGKDSFSYKVMLPKLALGILMVPFTWWFVQWTISIASVVTSSVITIPAETMQSKEGRQSWVDTPSIPKDITIDESSGDPAKKKPVEKCTAANCIAPSTFLRDGSGMYGYMMVYAYSVFKFHEVTQLPQGLDILKTGLGIIHQGIIAAIMFVVFGLLTIALVAILLVRAIKLWVYAIFSPLFTFQFVAGSAMMGGDKDTFTLKEFIGLAFVPAIVGLALSFGLILINAVSSNEIGPNPKKCDATKLRGEGCEIISITGNPKNSIIRKIQGTGAEMYTQNIVNFGGVSTTFNGKAGPSTDAAAVDNTNTMTGTLNSAGGIFGTLIIDIIALVFIWIAFMAAKTVNKTVSMAFEPFERIGGQVANLAKSIPKYTPIPGLGMSMSGVDKAVQKQQMNLESKSQERDANSSIGRWAGLQPPLTPATQDAIKKLSETTFATASNLQLARAQLSAQSNEQKQTGTIDALNNLTKALGDNVGKDNFAIKNPTEFKRILMEGLKIDSVKAEQLMIELDKKHGVLAKDYFKTDLKGQDILKAIYAGGAQTEGTGTGSTGGASSGVGSRASDTSVNINIAGTSFTVENKKGEKNVVFGSDDSTRLKGKKAGMTAEEFRKSVMTNGNMIDTAADDLITKITKDHPDFFTKPTP